MSRLDRLRSSKTTISDDLDKQRASTQFEPEEESTVSSSAADAFGAGETTSKKAETPTH